MKADTQHLIIIGTIIVMALFILKDQYTAAEGLAIGLVGFLSQKTLTDKQSEMLEESMNEDLQKE